MNSAAAKVSAGVSPFGPAAAAKRPSQALAVTRVAQPASASASVAKLAKVGVCVLFSPSAIVAP